MACVEHDWFFATACPRCAALQAPPPETSEPAPHPEPQTDAGVPERPGRQGPPAPAEPVRAAVTAPVTAPYVEPPEPYGPWHPLDIPTFLQRRPDGGFVYPSLHGGERRPAPVPAPAPVSAPEPVRTSDMPNCSPAKVERYKGIMKPRCHFGHGCPACWAKYNAVRFGGQGMTDLAKAHAVKQRGKRRR